MIGVGTLTFVDTNVLVYAVDSSEPEKQPRARKWLEWLWRERQGRLSVQVLQEYYVTVTRKLTPGLDLAAARADIRTFSSWNPLAADATLLDEAWKIEDKHEISFWDALIVAAARRSTCRYLLTEDLQDGQDLHGVRVINPFGKQPEDLLTPSAGS